MANCFFTQDEILKISYGEHAAEWGIVTASGLSSSSCSQHLTAFFRHKLGDSAVITALRKNINVACTKCSAAQKLEVDAGLDAILNWTCDECGGCTFGLWRS